MKPKQVIEVLTQERNYWKRKYEMHKNNPSPIIREPYKRKVESLDHAITCVGAIEQIKWERDIAIQQLHELGYQLGEEITSCTRCKFGSIIIDGAGIEHQDCDIGKKALSPVCRNKCNYFELNEDKE